MSCPSCSTKVKREEGLQCSGRCQQVYHLNCITKDGTTKPEPKSWLCSNCLQVCDKSYLDNNFQEIKAQLKSLQTDYKEVISKLEVITSLQSRMQSLESEVKNLQKLSSGKDQVIDDLHKRVCRLEQYSRKNSFEIREVQPAKDESVENIALKLADKLGVPLALHEIQAAHRLPASSGKIPGIIVNLASRKKRDLIVSSKKVVTNLELTGVGSGRVWVGDSLSPHYKNLLWKARMRAKEVNYKFVWWRRDVLVRKDENAPVFKIICENDLARMI